MALDMVFSHNQTVWQVSENREITIDKAFLSGGKIFWTAIAGDNHFTVSETDITAVPELQRPLEIGERIQVNRVPFTVIRDAFPGLPGGKGVIARRIISEREKNGDYRSIEDLSARIGMSQVDWTEVGLKCDFS